MMFSEKFNDLKLVSKESKVIDKNTLEIREVYELVTLTKIEDLKKDKNDIALEIAKLKTQFNDLGKDIDTINADVAITPVP